MRKTFFLCLCTIFFGLSSCKEETAAPLDLTADLAYFPLELNRPLYYQLDSIVVLNTVLGVVYDTASLEVRETLVESFALPDGTTAFRGERWDRPLAGGAWRFRQTYTISRTNQTAERSEDNLRFTKLTFPLRTGKSWDGHTAFDDRQDFVIGGEFLDIYAGWNYRYAETETPVTLSTGLTFAEAILVEQADTDNLIDRRIAFERYAAGVGLIERFIDARHTQCRVCCSGNTATCIDLPWDEKAEKGFILRQTLLRQ